MKEFFQTLLRPDREEPGSAERTQVARAADILMIGEFQFLQLAYYEWHGEDLPTEYMDRLFSAYMLGNQVPHWARHYARRILDKDTKDFIDPHDPYYHRYDAEYITHVPEGRKHFVQAALFLVLILAGAFWISQYAVAKNKTFQFPPYVESDEAAESDKAPNPTP